MTNSIPSLHNPSFTFILFIPVIQHMQLESFFTDFRFSWWLNDYVKSVLGFVHYADVGSVANISEVYAASRFRVTVCRVSVCVYTGFCLERITVSHHIPPHFFLNKNLYIYILYTEMHPPYPLQT
jgi:hypothetical protein